MRNKGDKRGTKWKEDGTRNSFQDEEEKKMEMK